MSTINIAFDISPLKDGNSVRGVGYYTQMLSQALKQVAPKKSDFKNYQFDLITDKNQLTQKKYDLIHYPYFNPFQITLPGNTDIPLIVTALKDHLIGFSKKEISNMSILLLLLLIIPNS